MKENKIEKQQRKLLELGVMEKEERRLDRKQRQADRGAA